MTTRPSVTIRYLGQRVEVSPPAGPVTAVIGGLKITVEPVDDAGAQAVGSADGGVLEMTDFNDLRGDSDAIQLHMNQKVADRSAIP